MPAPIAVACFFEERSCDSNSADFRPKSGSSPGVRVNFDMRDTKMLSATDPVFVTTLRRRTRDSPCPIACRAFWR